MFNMIEFVRFKVPFEHLAKKPREITILPSAMIFMKLLFLRFWFLMWTSFFFCRLHVLQLSESDSNPVALKSLSSQPEDSVQQPSRFFRQLAKETLKPSISPANHVSWSVSTKQRRQISTTNKTIADDGLKLPLNQTKNHLQPWVQSDLKCFVLLAFKPIKHTMATF